MKLINHDCLPILVLYIVLAYLMLFVCMFCVLTLISEMLFIFMFCLGSLTHSLFISCITLHHAQCFYLLVFPNSMFTPLFFFMKGLCALRRNST